MAKHGNCKSENEGFKKQATPSFLYGNNEDLKIHYSHRLIGTYSD